MYLRDNCGDNIGANFDPSHLIWHGVDCPTAIRKLGGSIYHFHAKDTQVNEEEMGKNGFFPLAAGPSAMPAALPVQDTHLRHGRPLLEADAHRPARGGLRRRAFHRT